jgi:hypothetical protein
MAAVGTPSVLNAVEKALGSSTHMGIDRPSLSATCLAPLAPAGSSTSTAMTLTRPVEWVPVDAPRRPRDQQDRRSLEGRQCHAVAVEVDSAVGNRSAARPRTAVDMERGSGLLDGCRRCGGRLLRRFDEGSMLLWCRCACCGGGARWWCCGRAQGAWCRVRVVRHSDRAPAEHGCRGDHGDDDRSRMRARHGVGSVRPGGR